MPVKIPVSRIFAFLHEETWNAVLPGELQKNLLLQNTAGMVSKRRTASALTPTVLLCGGLFRDFPRVKTDVFPLDSPEQSLTTVRGFTLSSGLLSAQERVPQPMKLSPNYFVSPFYQYILLCYCIPT